jgi:hypothetical protein
VASVFRFLRATENTERKQSSQDNRRGPIVFGQAPPGATSGLLRFTRDASRWPMSPLPGLWKSYWMHSPPRLSSLCENLHL